MRQVFVVTTAALSFLLWNYFRTWTGVWVPIFSGILSSIWALGLVPLLGLSLDPLVLVVPMFLSARALSHSVQSMDRYHEEYFELKDRDLAIVKSYIEIFPAAGEFASHTRLQLVWSPEISSVFQNMRFAPRPCGTP